MRARGNTFLPCRTTSSRQAGPAEVRDDIRRNEVVGVVGKNIAGATEYINTGILPVAGIMDAPRFALASALLHFGKRYEISCSIWFVSHSFCDVFAVIVRRGSAFRN